MQTHDAKRVEIIIEAPMETRLTEVLEKAGVRGFTVQPVGPDQAVNRHHPAAPDLTVARPAPGPA